MRGEVTPVCIELIKINNIPRWAKCIVFVIKLNLLLPCVGLSALYLPTTDPALRHGFTPQSISLHSHAACPVLESWFNSQGRLVDTPPPFLDLGKFFIYGVGVEG